MKKIYKLLAVLLAIVTFSSCETYGDYDVEYSPIYPLSGEWIVNIYDANGQLLPDAEGYTCNTYNPADNVADKMWVKMSTASATWGILGKVNCNVQGLDFSGDNVPNLVDSADGTTSETTFTISGGKVTLDGYDTKTGYKADAIEFTLTSSKYPGQTMVVKGFRKTGWAGEDY